MAQKPLIIVNFKAYKEAVGKNAVRLARICEEVSKKTGVEIVVAVQEQDIYRVASQVKIEVFAQHVDPIEFGAHTGHDLPEGIKESGAIGTLINHSEHRLDIPTIKKTLQRAREAKLKTVVCAPKPGLAGEIARLGPDIIAIEPPELISGEVSVSTADPKIIGDTVRRVKGVADIPVLCGAGIKDANDVAMAIRLGASGVLVSSHVVKARYPEKVLLELCGGAMEGFKSLKSGKAGKAAWKSCSICKTK